MGRAVGTGVLSARAKILLRGVMMASTLCSLKSREFSTSSRSSDSISPSCSESSRAAFSSSSLRLWVFWFPVNFPVRAAIGMTSG